MTPKERAERALIDAGPQFDRCLAAVQREIEEAVAEERARFAAIVEGVTGPTGGWLVSPKKVRAAIESGEKP